MEDYLYELRTNLRNLWKMLSVWVVGLAVAIQAGWVSLPPVLQGWIDAHPDFAAALWVITFLLARAVPQGLR
jgi:hypothetical protein